MALGIYSLLEAGLLFVNAIAILNEKRFLAKYISGSSESFSGDFGDSSPGVKAQVLTLIRSVHTVLRIPLIAVNVVVIVLKLLLG